MIPENRIPSHPGEILLALFLLLARSEDKPAERKRNAVAATTALEKAIKLNSFLRNQYEPLLKEANPRF